MRATAKSAPGRKSKLVCITGLPGAGKSTAADFFVAKGYQYLRFGQINLDIIKQRGLVPNEKNESKIREEIREKHGMAAMAILNISKFKQLLKKGGVLGDGLYSYQEYEILRKEFGNALIVIAIFAPPKLRHKRLSERKTRPLTKAQAESRDIHELINLNKGPTIAMADHTVLNTKDKQYLLDQLRNLSIPGL